MNPVLFHDERSYRGHGPLPTAVLVGAGRARDGSAGGSSGSMG